ncbi:unnamed protein product [Rotaria sp. Silwood2]|nr:unnamed protein product [Rotaria sp. Silwood2]CAF4699595.1 unnamed protein product [Rotaria sp. Silwood2]
MHFNAEAASQNSKPVQCYICLQYNHVAKYCKTKQQVCSQCGDNHRIELCTAANDAIKCCNCKGNHLATSNDCPNYKEQHKRMLILINQYSSTSKPTVTAPAIHDVNEFPSLPVESLVNDDTFDPTSDSDEEIQMLNDNNNKQQQPAATTKKPIKQNNKPTTTSSDTTSKTPTTTNTTLTQSSNTANDNTKKPTIKQKPTAKTSKRNRSPNSSLDSTTMDNKDLKANTNDD